ncbi:MAG: VOC family protein [Woeseiaceae bacterium]
MSFRRSRLAIVVGCWLLGACVAIAPEPESPEELSAWSSVTVGVRDLDSALELWIGTFGFNVAKLNEGPDENVARLWGLAASDIARQALVRTGDSQHGMVHFVEFNDPALPVRHGAQVYDLVPKNLDVYVDDMPRRFAELKADGKRFRTDSFSEVTAPDGTAFREIHMPSHDDVNVVLLEVIGKPRPFTVRGFAGVGPLIFIVPDAPAEKVFFADVMQLDKLTDNLFKGPEIERMVGLPPGAGLDVSIWGREGNDFGEIEIIEYQGVRGNDLYPLAKPKALGVLHISYVVDELHSLLSRLEARGVTVNDHGFVRTMSGEGRVISFQSPAGLRIEVYDRGSSPNNQ